MNLIKEENFVENEINISFYVVQIFIKIPLNAVIQVVKEVIDLDMIRLEKVCACSTFFSFQGEYYE